MDLRLHANPPLQYRVNGRNARQGDDTLRFLSPEEQECLQFFEDTIESLEDNLEENKPRPRQMTPLAISGRGVQEVDGPLPSGPRPAFAVSTPVARPPSPKGQDIIDLVHPEVFNSTSPDFPSAVPTPEGHFEVKPRRDSLVNLPSEYNPPLPSGSYGPTDSRSYHPPGCIPTPVLIAQKIAENQAGGASNSHPASLPQRSSADPEKSSGYITDPHVKQGPLTSARPSRFPANINVMIGNKDHQNQSLSNVTIQERRAQMLANLTGSHPLLQDPQQATAEEIRNVPRRSISFKDPSPDKSRMEALSKLGLSRNRAMSGGMSLLATSKNTSLDLTGEETSAYPLNAGDSSAEEIRIKGPETAVTTQSPTRINVERKPEILQTHPLTSPEDRNPHPSPSHPAVAQSVDFPPPPLELGSPPLEVTSPEFNSYGGKSIIVNPSLPTRSEPATASTFHEPKTPYPAPPPPTQVNSNEGRTRFVTPVPVSVTRNDLPDILSSHINKTQTLPAKPPPNPVEFNSYGGKSLTISASAAVHRPSNTPPKSFKAPAPATAPKPSRHSYHGPVAPPKAASRSASMFRPQGITVQFSGRHGTEESRRDALRKLGLLKDY